MIQLLIILILFYLFFILTRYEGFTLLEEKSYVRIDKDIVDPFYCKVYDDLYNTIDIHKKECKTIVPYLNENSDVLCLECRTGHIVQLLSNFGNITGLDSSSFMIEQSKKIYPNLSFQTLYYDPYKYKHKTHIICPLYCFHSQLDIGHFLSICYNWLIHKGYLFISLFKPTDISQMVQHKPSYKFQHNYTFSLDVEDKPGYSIIREHIYDKHGTIKRKNIWNYQSIQLDNLIYESGLRGFKFIKQDEHIAVFSKST